MKSIPGMFFIDDKLYKRIKLVKSDDSVVVFDFAEETRSWMPISAVLKNYKRAFTITQASNLLQVPSRIIKEVINKGLVTSPIAAYSPLDFSPRGYYISEDNMMELREAVWDLLPKNRYGEPYRDTVASESDLRAKLYGTEERNYVIRDDEFIQIFSV